MKSTPTRGVKQTLKPDAYKQWEPRYQIICEAKFMYYVYVLQNEANEADFYLGQTSDLRRRLADHNEGRNRSTKGRTWKVVYYEAYVTRQAAMKRERLMKNDGRSRRAVMDRVKASLTADE